MKKTLKVLLILILVMAVGGVLATRHGDAEKDTAEKPETTAVVKRGTIDVSVTATGKVVAHQVVEVKSKAGGEVIQIVPEEGDAVAKGDLIVELDPSDERRTVERARSRMEMEAARLAIAKSNLELSESDYQRGIDMAGSDVDSARAALEEARLRFDRQRELRAQGAVSEQELDTARSTFTQAQARFDAMVAQRDDREKQKINIDQRRHDIILAEAQHTLSKVELEEAQERFDETRIVAPVAGVLTTRAVEVGQVISSAISNVGGGTTLLKISDVSRLYIDASIDEVDIGTVKIGQQATITADAYATEQFVGKVLRISPEGLEVNSVVVFNVRLEVEGSGRELLKPGMTVNVSILAGKRDNALLIPVNTIFYERDRSYVILDDNPDEEKATKVYPVTGMNDGLRVEVLEGLKEGDVIKIRQTIDNKTWRRRR